MAIAPKTKEINIQPVILKKVDPAPWHDEPLVLNKRNFHWVTEKFVELSREKLQPGGGGVLSLP